MAPVYMHVCTVLSVRNVLTVFRILLHLSLIKITFLHDSVTACKGGGSDYLGRHTIVLTNTFGIMPILMYGP